MLLHPGDDLNKCLALARPGCTIHLSSGDYHVKTDIPASGITIIGAGAGISNIIWDDYAVKRDARWAIYGTFRSWTMAVTADNVTLKGLSVINNALSPQVKGQEIALAVYGDHFRAEDCIFSSTQDTLFLGPLPRDLIMRYDRMLPDRMLVTGPLRQYFKNCIIEGTIDFIFGCGEAVFEACELRSLKDVRGKGYTAAPAHWKTQDRGFLFDRCRFTHEPGVAHGSVYLARPWRDYGLCEYKYCQYEDHISPYGFDKWNDTCRDKTARFYETPAVEGRVPWINRK